MKAFEIPDPIPFAVDKDEATVNYNHVVVLRDDQLAKIADAVYTRMATPVLLACVDCHHTESPAGALARHFNHGRCLHCGGSFRVARA